MRRESITTTALPSIKGSSNNNSVSGIPNNMTTSAAAAGNQVSRKDLTAAPAAPSHRTTTSSFLYSSSSATANDPSSCRCAVPTTCVVGQDIQMTDLHDSVKVICNNDACPVARFMHRECFESWEETVLSFLRSTGRARSWSEKQRLQNLWTKKGYDLTYKACGCKCGKGHLRKDLDWIPPPAVSAVDAEAAAANGKKKRRNRRKARPDRPSLVILSSNSSNHNNNNPVNNNSGPSASNQSSGTTALSRRNSSSTSNNNSTYSNSNNNHYNSGHGALPDRHRDRTSSMSSSGSAGTSNGGVSPPIFATDLSRSPDLQATSVRKLFFGESERNRSHSLNHNQQQPHQQQQPPPLQQQIQAFRERSNSGTMFGRRPDYSTFNILPRTKINSYHIRMEDETSHGNDDIRTLILSTLSSNGMNCVHCIVCSSSMPIFERFPLIDGTFFLSPRQHSKAAVQIVGASIERKFLNAVCMGCMEGWNSSLRCRSCRTKWDGSHLILGSMYSYDIFAAVPCCISRLKCCNCNNLAISAGRRLEFFSDYSQNLACSHCGIKDFHFVKPLYITFMPSNAPGGLLVMKS